MAIDTRLLDCDTQMEVEENFNRTLALVDALTTSTGQDEEAITELQSQVDALKVCAVSFDSDGGTAVPTQYMLNGAVAVEPAAPTKASKVFDGWYNGDTAWVFTDAVTDTMTLTAHWADEPTP